mgnify:CR=1 FL=1|jgi:acid stress-induced BolA-like protein IbaG/YrbA
MHKEDIKKIIGKGISCSYLEVMGDDGAHFETIVVSDEFAGINRVARHQLVYKALGDLMKEKIHALSMKLYDVNEWKNIKGDSSK